ncbi:Surface presentation of antigens protein SpaO [Pandoraea terrae]|uniref:Surface presentation of antigens protein SpaO n=1 Tax=Pandoraea terrae TaxID=1537710 RepID=A0A5E4TB71_9BURK|nr:type III secretion system cytoplasmic ring protein SctQ [Pandoraea terrae]VVD84522.1 Surface presentation of antigens protein SpaO [Pandoraea terrae]
MLKLRAIDASLHRMQHAVAVWSRQGWDAQMAPSPEHGNWVPVSDEGGRWAGWLDPLEWLTHESPKLGALSRSSGNEQLAVEMMSSMDQPIAFGIPDLAYERVHVGKPVSPARLRGAGLIRVTARECVVWLSHVTVSDRLDEAASHVFEQLAMVLDFEVGSSRVRLSTLRSIAPGDVLLVRDPMARVSCQGFTVGGYRRTGETIVMEEPMESTQGDTTLIPGASIERLPIELTFVLQRQRMPLAQLRTLVKGDMIEMMPGAEQRVEVRVNDSWIGSGELVQLDGRLGVCVTQWFGDDMNV